MDRLYQLNYGLVCKLLAMNYSQEFSTKFKCPPISSYYFCRESNQAQQFFSFCCLSAYILNKLDAQSNFKVDIFDDPGVTIDKIVTTAGKHIDVEQFNQQKSKLRLGYGFEVLTFLNNLITTFLGSKDNNLNTAKSSIKLIRVVGGVNSEEGNDQDEDDDNEEDVEIDEENEIELEEEFDDYIITEEESPFMDMWDDQQSESGEANAVPTVEQAKKEMIISTTNSTEWRLELERVQPQLTARSLSKLLAKSGVPESEWRLHYETMLAQRTNIDVVNKQVSSHLRRLLADLQSSLEKISTKENYLQQNLNIMLAEWANVKTKVADFRQHFEAIETETKDKSQRLQVLNDESRAIKQSVEEYSFRMTDNSPLVEAKKARDILRQDLIKVNLQIGVAIQTLVRHASIYTTL